jgi:hypothetical protein
MIMPFAPYPAFNARELASQAFRIANRAIVADVQTECTRVTIDGLTWWDTLPMLSEHEHSNEVLDMVTEALSFGLASGLLVRHPNLPQLVRISAEAQVAVEWADDQEGTPS